MTSPHMPPRRGREPKTPGQTHTEGPMTTPYPAELYPGCPCGTCLTKVFGEWRMWLCPTCGNKRCPGAVHHTRHEDRRTDFNDLGA